MNSVKRKLYYKENGKLKFTQIDGFTGCDRIDTSKEYMNAARDTVGGLNSKKAYLICIDGGK